MNEELLKTLNGAIDSAIKELVAVETLQKSVDLQEAKLRPESHNGSLSGDNRGDTALKPEDAHKSEAPRGASGSIAAAFHADPASRSGQSASGTSHMAPGHAVRDPEPHSIDPAIDPRSSPPDRSVGDVPSVKGGDTAKKAEDDKKKKDGKKDHDKDDDDDMDDEKAAKLKAKLEKYEHKKKMGMPMAAPGAMLSKSEEVEAFQKAMTKSLKKSLKKAAKAKVEKLAKSMDERLAAIEGMIQKVATAPVARQSASGLAPLVKSEADAAGAASAPAAGGSTLSKGEVLDKLFTLQKSGDARIDSQVIARVDVGDYSVLAEKNISLK